MYSSPLGFGGRQITVLGYSMGRVTDFMGCGCFGDFGWLWAIPLHQVQDHSFTLTPFLGTHGMLVSWGPTITALLMLLGVFLFFCHGAVELGVTIAGGCPRRSKVSFFSSLHSQRWSSIWMARSKNATNSKGGSAQATSHPGSPTTDPSRSNRVELPHSTGGMLHSNGRRKHIL